MHSISEAYEYRSDPMGIGRLADAELSRRERSLRNELDFAHRRLDRFEDFCGRVDLEALGTTMVEEMHDVAGGIDWRAAMAGHEYDAVTLEIEHRRRLAAGEYDQLFAVAPGARHWLDNND